MNISELFIQLITFVLSVFSLFATPNFLLFQEQENPVCLKPEELMQSSSSEETVPTHETPNFLITSSPPARIEEDVYKRLFGSADLTTEAKIPTPEIALGTEKWFIVLNSDTFRYEKVLTTLQGKSEHLYVWIENGVAFEPEVLTGIIDKFESEIYPQTRRTFGHERSPGIDNDHHIYVVFANPIGENLGGYFSSRDMISPLLNSASNGHEMFFVKASIGLDHPFMLTVLAHEFQHMIHWNMDRNEYSWLNEGLSTLAASLFGNYTPELEATLYLEQPDTQVNYWPSNTIGQENNLHYSATYLLIAYIYDQFGEDAINALTQDPLNGIDSIDSLLQELTNQYPNADHPSNSKDLFLNWAIANYLQDPSLYNGKFAYETFNEIKTTPSITPGVKSGEFISADVHQFGVDYIQFSEPGTFSFEFTGALSAQLIPQSPHNGEYMYWSNRADKSDTMLTKEFDFTDVDGPLTFSFWCWHDIEENNDFVYFLASTDGKTWTIVNRPPDIPSNQANDYRWGYTGISNTDGQWTQKTYDISGYAGTKVYFRFEYLTDMNALGYGFAIDDINIPELDYYEGFENENGGWMAAGFLRIGENVPQTFRLAMISEGSEIAVKPIDLEENNSAKVDFTIGKGVDQVTFVILGTTQLVYEKAPYRYSATGKPPYFAKTIQTPLTLSSN